MKKQMNTLMAVAVFAMTLTVMPVHAQNAGNLSVTIPFEFSAAGKTLPAGDYYLRRSLNGARVSMRIESKDGSLGIYLPTHVAQSAEIQPESKLVFTKYGSQLFLSQVWAAGRSAGEELNKTSRERNLQSEIAGRSGKPETITIAAKAN
jgi:antitoxin component of MazEF toxin-antitoxin module